MTLIEIIESYPEYAWLIAGAILVGMEAFAAPGIGFLFTGLAAITVGALVGFGIIDVDATWAQFGWFFLFTAVWGAILWKPLKRWRLRTSEPAYRNMRGQTGSIAEKPLERGKKGRVKWSGTVMDARMADDCPVDTIDVDQEVEVFSVEGNLLRVSVPGVPPSEQEEP